MGAGRLSKYTVEPASAVGNLPEASSCAETQIAARDVVAQVYSWVNALIEHAGEVMNAVDPFRRVAIERIMTDAG